MAYPLFHISKFCIWLGAIGLFFFRRRNRDKIPTSGPVLLAGNHVSFLDPPMLALGSRRMCRVMARATLGQVPLLGAWMRGVGVIFVDRRGNSRSAIEAAIEALRGGAVMAIFPEGTRSGNGELQPFQRGILLLVKKTGATVVPSGIRGSFRAWPRGRRLPRLFRPCSVSFGEPMAADEVLGDGGLEELRRRVAELSGQPLATQGDELSARAGEPAAPSQEELSPAPPVEG